MATFDDNIKTIGTAIYGKEMRPAISEALTQSWSAVKVMVGAVDQLKSRLDKLDGGGQEDIIPPMAAVYGSVSDGICGRCEPV